MRILATILLMLVTQSALAGSIAENEYWAGKGTWHPTSDLKEVVIMVNWTYESPVPCGEHKDARACAFPPTDSDIPREGKLCEITHPDFDVSPTDKELETIGKLFKVCMEEAGTRIKILL